MQSNKSAGEVANAPFTLQLIKPFSTYDSDGKVQQTDFIVSGLLTAGGLSILGAKPKVGKSSLSRYLATCVSKGQPFLGRSTQRGEVLLISLEDPRSHTDNALGVLGYDSQTDAQIHIVERVSPDKQETIVAIRKTLAALSDVRLIIIDHLAPFLNIGDLSEYMPTLRGINLLRDLARDFPKVHILCLAHAKKVRTDDPFDGILGSTALRGTPETNIVLLNERGRRVIVSETRVGRAIPATILNAEMVTSAGSDVAKGFSLGEPFNQWEGEKREKAEKKQSDLYTRRVVDFLAEREGQAATQRDVIDGVVGKTERIMDAIKSLELEGIVTASGAPKTVTLKIAGDALELYRLAK
jgi:hypothetical protein